jgi:valyl-tRNA synthetase
MLLFQVLTLKEKCQRAKKCNPTAGYSEITEQMPSGYCVVKTGEDFDYQEKDVITGKRFITKLLIYKFLFFMNLKDYIPGKIKLIETDRMFLVMLNELVVKCTNAFEAYEYSRAKSEADNFFWNFCDNYLEIVKDRVYNGTDEEKESAFYVLYTSLFTILKLMAPFIPFVTEEIYQKYFRNKEGIKTYIFLNGLLKFL